MVRRIEKISGVNVSSAMTGKLFKVKALYDFVASHPDDLGFNQNEVLTITNSDYGDGWYYGSNNIGREGMIPSSYVEALPPSMPPPPLPGNSPVGKFEIC